LRGDVNYAWPSAEIAVMGAKGAVEILHSAELRKIEDDPTINKEEFLQTKEEEYRNQFSNPSVAAARGYIDDIIVPSSTRLRIAKALSMLEGKSDSNPKKKHGNMPL
jgi:propionyl-CoA carboxylase beta chain